MFRGESASRGGDTSSPRNMKFERQTPVRVAHFRADALWPARPTFQRAHLALANCDPPIDRHLFDHILASADPLDFDAVDAILPAQAEMQP